MYVSVCVYLCFYIYLCLSVICLFKATDLIQLVVSTRLCTWNPNPRKSKRIARMQYSTSICRGMEWKARRKAANRLMLCRQMVLSRTTMTTISFGFSLVWTFLFLVCIEGLLFCDFSSHDAQYTILCNGEIPLVLFIWRNKSFLNLSLCFAYCYFFLWIGFVSFFFVFFFFFFFFLFSVWLFCQNIHCSLNLFGIIII
jgi:hypothetical protein